MRFSIALIAVYLFSIAPVYALSLDIFTRNTRSDAAKLQTDMKSLNAANGKQSNANKDIARAQAQLTQDQRKLISNKHRDLYEDIVARNLRSDAARLQADAKNIKQSLNSGTNSAASRAQAQVVQDQRKLNSNKYRDLYEDVVARHVLRELLDLEAREYE